MPQTTTQKLPKKYIDVSGLKFEHIEILRKLANSLKEVKAQNKEKKAWLKLGEKSMSEIWDNPQDEKIWKQYL